MFMSFTNTDSLYELVEVYINLEYKVLCTIMAAIVNFQYVLVVGFISFPLETSIHCIQLNKYQYNLCWQGCTSITVSIIPYTLNVT